MLVDECCAMLLKSRVGRKQKRRQTFDQVFRSIEGLGFVSISIL